MGVPGDEIFYLISTLITDSENIYIDYKINGPISAEHPMRPLQTKDQAIPSYMKLNQSFKSCASICLLDLNSRVFFV